MDTRRGGEGGTNWESRIDIQAPLCVERIASGELCITLGVQLRAGWWEEGIGARGRGYVCVYVCTLLSSRN